MSQADPSGEPAWAREAAFPKKPDDADFGVVDEKQAARPFETLQELKAYLATGKGRLYWVWTPESSRLVAPEEVPDLAKSLRKRRLIFAQEDEDDARRTFPFSGIAVLYAAYVYASGGQAFGFAGLDLLVLALFVFLYFTARPWWEARRGRAEADKLKSGEMAAEIPEARFDLWMEQQKTPLTIILGGLLMVVGVGQFFTDGLGIREAGFDKARYAMGEHWRLFTGAFLHGNLIHFILNASALWYLGRRVEILARWPHLSGVFFLSLIGAGWVSLEWKPDQLSVGISGVVCGFLGFLLVFETLHRRLVPHPARRRLAAILISLVGIGILGFRFIDNAAHFGGLITGAAYAVVVFPKSSSPQRPAILWQDRLIGGTSLVLIFLSALAALGAMLF
jgi:membrane associated rhomboid family serine protease